MSTTPECGWPGCDHPARLTVLSGAALEQATPQGWFWVPHAAIHSRQVRAERHEAVWFDWARPPTLRAVRTHAAGEPATD